MTAYTNPQAMAAYLRTQTPSPALTAEEKLEDERAKRNAWTNAKIRRRMERVA